MENIEAEQTRLSLEKDFLAMKAQKDAQPADEYSEYEESQKSAVENVKNENATSEDDSYSND